MISVIKRDKETAGFQLTKLTASIEKALQAVGNTCRAFSASDDGRFSAEDLRRRAENRRDQGQRSPRAGAGWIYRGSRSVPFI